MFTNGLGDRDSIPGQAIPKTQKTVLDASLLNTQPYIVRIKHKWNNLGKGVTPSSTTQQISYWKDSPNGCPGYDSKQIDGEVAVMLQFWGMRSTPLLSALSGPFWPGVVASDRVLSMDQIELNCILMLNWIAWNRIVLRFKRHTNSKLNWLKWNCLFV